MRVLHVLTLLHLLGACAPRDDGARLLSARCGMVSSANGSCLLWDVSIIELIARPEVFDGKAVRVIGFLNLEFEGNAVYLSKADWEYAISANGLWIDPPAISDSVRSHAEAFPNRKYVLVEAVFRAGPSGHFGGWPGALTQVTRLDHWTRHETDTSRFKLIDSAPPD